jgi:hypothetical protein
LKLNPTPSLFIPLLASSSEFYQKIIHSVTAISGAPKPNPQTTAEIIQTEMTAVIKESASCCGNITNLLFPSLIETSK